MPELTTTCLLVMPEQQHLFGYIRANAPFAREMVPVTPSRTGQTLALCGAGPSLASATLAPADEVWACNSALPYLLRRGERVTHGFAIDQGEAMLADWPEPYDVGYYLATSVSPRLVAHLAGRPVQWFHNFLGIPDPAHWTPKTPGLSYEMALYRDASLFGSGVQVGHGLNSVPRALCLALHMGFAHIAVYGADCACAPGAEDMPHPDSAAFADWLETLTVYADGRRASLWGPRPAICEGEIDGRRWHTRADMAISARHLLEMARAYPGRVAFVGDTMLNALADKDADYWSRWPTLEGFGQISGLRKKNPLARAA
jgi:hypothetical protein